MSYFPHDNSQQFIQMKGTAQGLTNFLDGIDLPFFLLKSGLQILKFIFAHGVVYDMVLKLSLKYTMPNAAGKFLFVVPGPHLINQLMCHAQGFGNPVPITRVKNQLNRILKTDLMTAGNKNGF